MTHHTPEGFAEYAARFRNWGRWGDDDQRGAVNLVDERKVREASLCIRLGERMSLSRPYPSIPAPTNPMPARNFYWTKLKDERGTSGVFLDHLSISYHGQASTHLDALCHLWGSDGLWNGRDPATELDGHGARWGGIEHWQDGIVTRAVLIDVARVRETGFVDMDGPVTAGDLERAATADGVEPTPGDALVIHCGRERWEAHHGRAWGSSPDDVRRPGLDASCLEFFFDIDCSVVLWDMMDERPNRFRAPHTVHAALYNQGVALVDNSLVEPFATRCRAVGHLDAFLSIAPLPVRGGTGSPVNPIAIL